MQIQVSPTYRRTAEVKERIVVYRGAARSGKTFTMIQKVALWLYTGNLSGEYVPEGSFTIIRLTFPALRASIMRELIDYLHELDIYKHIDHKKSIHELHYNKRFVAFIPADDQQKLRGRKHTYCLFEECNDVDFEAFNQVLIRTAKQVFLTTNPSGHPWVRTEIEEKRLIDWRERGLEKPDVHLDISVYQDNPFLDDIIRTEIENLKFTDKSLYQIYALGLWTDLKGVIFPEFELVTFVPDGKVYYGVDFGWNDPTSIVRVTIVGMDLYIESILYAREQGLDTIADTILMSCGNNKVYCDSAEPRTIYELKRRGVNAKAAKKGRDSILQGLTFMRQHKIFVHENSVEAIDEFKKYKWQEDNDGRVIDKPIDIYNHVADSCRYAVSTALGSRMKLL